MAAVGVAFRLLVFAGSWLLFQSELIVAKLLLPGFGSSASVWTTSLVFFQVALLLGYLYAARVAGAAASGRYRWGHLLFVLLPVLALPFRIVRPALPPELGVLAALAIGVGWPFLALATTSVVAQAWLMRTAHPARGDPYFLYGTSNAGALLALLTYPFVVEPVLDLGAQQWCWGALYVAYVLLHALCLLAVAKASPGDQPAAAVRAHAPERGRPRVLYWGLLSAAANALLMAVTNVITADAPLPLLWIVPLTIYLLTLILCFAPRVPSRRLFDVLILAGVAAAGGALVLLVRHIHLQLAYVVLHCMVLWVVCLILHRNLAEAKPSGSRLLGAYYLALSAGGALGALLVGLLMPLLSRRISTAYIDYVAAAAVVLAALLTRDAAALRGWAARRPARAAVLLGCALLLAGGLSWAGVLYERGKVHGSRTFYGLYSVTDRDGLRWFHHGNTIHGVESLEPSREGEPLAYFHRGSPIAGVLASPLPRSRVGLAGLGVGTLLAYGRPGDRWDVFELDAEVEDIARRHFSFLSRSRAEARVIIGDARLTLEQVPDGEYELLILDAFSSDYIPTHLLTREALGLYLRKLAPGGLILCQISNRNFDLRKVLTRLAAEHGAYAAWAGGVEPDPERHGDGRFASLWFAITRDPRVHGHLVGSLGWKAAAATPAIAAWRPWSDDYVNLFQALDLQ